MMKQKKYSQFGHVSCYYYRIYESFQIYGTYIFSHLHRECLVPFCKQKHSIVFLIILFSTIIPSNSILTADHNSNCRRRVGRRAARGTSFEPVRLRITALHISDLAVLHSFPGARGIVMLNSTQKLH